MQLYQLPFSHNCSKVRIVALEKGIDLELPALPNGGTRSEEFLALNPLGQVPFFVDGGFKLGESEVIVEYLEERFPTPDMLPKDIKQRAYSRWLSRFHDLYLAKQLSTLYFALVKGRAKEPEILAELDELFRLLNLLESQVNPSPYFLGGTFSLCDAAHALSFLYVEKLTTAYERPVSPDSIPKLWAWYKAVSLRPSVAQVYKECEQALNG